MMIEELEEAIDENVSRETLALLQEYQSLLVDESYRQNLIARSSIGEVWSRHIVDSVQLLPLAPKTARTWIDIGSGAGLPGVPIACFRRHLMTLVEPRRLRAQFLDAVVNTLGLSADVQCVKAERVAGAFDVISARAVASLDRLLAMTRHLSHSATEWILPKGRSAKSELEELRRNWHCAVREVPSRTSPDSAIFVISKVKAKRP